MLQSVQDFQQRVHNPFPATPPCGIHTVLSTFAGIFDRFRKPRRPDSSALATHAGASNAACVRPAPTGTAIAAQGLFVIGAARTGTTILQNALNSSDAIFLFGEPGFHRDPGSADFAARYNGMHRAWGNQENKSSHCPALFETDAIWWAYLTGLAGLYRYVGSKIVINPEHAAEESRQLFDFHCRHFYTSHYIFSFRNPLDVLMSTRGLAQLNGGRVATHKEVLSGFFAIVQLFFRALRNLPHVHVLFHEAISTDAFAALGEWLGMPLTRAMSYYDHAKVRHYELSEVPDVHRALVAEAMALYMDFQREALAGFDLTQIEQNDGHLDPVHFTALGRLSWRVTRFLDALAQHEG